MWCDQKKKKKKEEEEEEIIIYENNQLSIPKKLQNFGLHISVFRF